MSDEDSPVTLNKLNMTTSTGKSLSLSMPDISALFGERFKLQTHQPVVSPPDGSQQQQQSAQLLTSQQQPINPNAPKRKGALKGQRNPSLPAVLDIEEAMRAKRMTEDDATDSEEDIDGSTIGFQKMTSRSASNLQTLIPPSTADHGEKKAVEEKYHSLPRNSISSLFAKNKSKKGKSNSLPGNSLSYPNKEGGKPHPVPRKSLSFTNAEENPPSLPRNSVSFSDVIALWKERNKEASQSQEKSKYRSQPFILGDKHRSSSKNFQAPSEKLKWKTQSQRNRKLASTDDSGLSDSGQQSPNNSLTHSDVAKLNQKKKSTFWPSPFGKSQEKEDLLRLKLESWSTNGLPAMPDLITIGKRHFDRAAFELPANWQDIVQHQDLTKRQRDQQERVWELLKTEVKYILRLSVIKDLFMCCLINLQNEGVLNEIDSEQVFSNILDVHEGNALLWQDHMREVVVKSKEEDTPLDPSYMKEGFQSIGELLHPYTKYCLEQEPCQEYIKKKCHESELFKIFVEWCEAQKQCNRLKLTDLMVSPMHRLTRYKLLLEAIIKYTEDDTQKEDLLMMVEKVNAFAKQVDNAMRQKQEQSRLSKIINRIESYEAVEAPNEECARLIGQFNRIDLTMPMQGCSSQQKRHLIKEGSLKLRDSTIKTEVYVFLFTDMLLLTKCKERKSDRVKVIKPPMRLDHVLVFMLKDGISFLLVHLNEFNVASAMYTLHGEAKNWVTYIEKAQKDYRNLWKLNLERPETGLEYLNTSDEEDEYSGDFNITEHLALSRVESMSSADVFIPNIGNISHISRSNSHSSLVRNQSLGDERIHASSPLLHDESFKKPRSMTYHDDLQGHSQGHSQGHQGHFSNRGHHLSHKSLSETSDDSFTSLSLPLRETKSGSGSISTADDDSTSTPLPGRPDLLLEENRSKLANRRKSGAEKRYYTADHIQDLQAKEKDTSIHKRYSLNFGNNANERSAALHDKTISSDSLRSMPSSSGVSSTGSLHLSPDTDIYEECESENASVSSIRYVPPTTQVPDRISEEDPSNLSSTESSSSQSHDVAAVKKFSKSLPDVSTLMSLSKSTPAEDGIASVQLLKHEGEKKKLTHAEMRKITKNLLLNSTLEATEV